MLNNDDLNRRVIDIERADADIPLQGGGTDLKHVKIVSGSNPYVVIQIDKDGNTMNPQLSSVTNVSGGDPLAVGTKGMITHDHKGNLLFFYNSGTSVLYPTGMCYADKGDPTINFDGAAEFDAQPESLGVAKEAYYRFAETAMSSATHFFVPLGTSSYEDFYLFLRATVAGRVANCGLQCYAVIADFDTTTLTWNNRPAIWNTHYGTLELHMYRSGDSDNIDLNNVDRQTGSGFPKFYCMFTVGGDVASAIGGGNTVYGFLLRPYVASTAEPANAGFYGEFGDRTGSLPVRAFCTTTGFFE